MEGDELRLPCYGGGEGRFHCEILWRMEVEWRVGWRWSLKLLLLRRMVVRRSWRMCELWYRSQGRSSLNRHCDDIV